MPHEYDEVMVGGKKKDETNEKVSSISIRKLDDGTYHYSVCGDKMGHMEYSFGSMDEMVKALKDDMTSPHMKKKKSLSGGALMKELSKSKHKISPSY